LALLLLGLAIGIGLLLPQLLAPRPASQLGNAASRTPEPTTKPIAVIAVQPATATSQPHVQKSSRSAEPTLAVSPTLALTQTASLITPTLSASQLVSAPRSTNGSVAPRVSDPISNNATMTATATAEITATLSAFTSTVTATVTLTPTTAIATPARQPTSTAIAPTTTVRPGLTKHTNIDNKPTPTSYPTTPTELLGAVQLDTPADNATLGHAVTFRWSLSKHAPPEVSQVFTPTSAYLFEVVVFADPGHLEEARALVQASKAPSATVNVDVLQNSPWHFIEGNEYYWSVRLGKTVNARYQALGLLAPPRRFVFRPTTDK
jgi:hypothetical protein